MGPPRAEVADQGGSFCPPSKINPLHALGERERANIKLVFPFPARFLSGCCRYSGSPQRWTIFFILRQRFNPCRMGRRGVDGHPPENHVVVSRVGLGFTHSSSNFCRGSMSPFCKLYIFLSGNYLHVNYKYPLKKKRVSIFAQWTHIELQSCFSEQCNRGREFFRASLFWERLGSVY